MSLRTFDPKDFTVSINGNVVNGYADGSFITVERSEDMWSMSTGADGLDTTRVKSNNKAGSITVTLAQSSASNDVLSALALADELTNSGAVKMGIEDANGTTIVAAIGWVRKLPNIEASKEVTTREWVFDCADMRVTVGSNNTQAAA